MKETVSDSSDIEVTIRTTPLKIAEEAIEELHRELAEAERIIRALIEGGSREPGAAWLKRRAGR